MEQVERVVVVVEETVNTIYTYISSRSDLNKAKENKITRIIKKE